ncbi:ECF RNA polymerase sigma factor SigE [Novipirellula artificiosorum]|uniref:ECF RNA polymerase sigma factor SigE n=2 Tax=Novipirellula artificiosorum TaxID=2528016 RepID=A0A5C6DQA0_9BACT|nr:ECF RNA polymerase sigma factor SigE [Novipirellula artificiosorum]
MDAESRQCPLDTRDGYDNLTGRIMNNLNPREDDGSKPDRFGLPDAAVTSELIRGCAAGDRAAMQEIYELCSDRVYSLMVRMVGQQDADDVTQQVFMQMFRKLDQFSGESKLETWLYRLATNEALQFIRKRKRQTLEPIVSEPVSTAPDRRLKSEDIEMLEMGLSRLDPELRAILSLKEEQGLSYNEIAHALEIPEGTVGSRLNRARKELREELLKLGWE